MDGLITSPLTLISLATAIVLTAYEMRSAFEPAECPECAHCRAAAIERQRRQHELQERFAREHHLDAEDDDRRIG